VLMVDGQPDKTVKSGESYQIPPGAVHDAKTGPNDAKVIATYVVEKGKHRPAGPRLSARPTAIGLMANSLRDLISRPTQLRPRTAAAAAGRGTGLTQKSPTPQSPINPNWV
jgi:hypothetical protein